MDANSEIILSPVTVLGSNTEQMARELTLQENALNVIPPNLGLFKILTANGWIKEARTRPIPKMLFGEFWHEGELGILFADTNQGKSILAYQIADSISRGVPIKGFDFTSYRQKVIYLDYELNSKQFQARYSMDYQDEYDFDDFFIRCEIDSDSEIPPSFHDDIEEYSMYSLEETIKCTNVKVVIVDNITYLRQATETAKDALPLMKKLKALKNRYDLSILAIAHTPKRDLTKPITRNDLAGSKMLINFCDSSFAIGESFKDSSFKYIKQIKQRATAELYGTDNVCVCQIIKTNSFLHFELIGFAAETEHLREASDKEKSFIVEQVKALNLAGKSLREIAEAVGVSHMTVKRYLKQS